MVDSRLKTTRPTDGMWKDYAHRIAGIYGANASGKSSALDALDFMLSVVRNSGTVWSNRSSLPYHPYALDEQSDLRPSHYSIDFVLDDVRFEYGFSMSREQIHAEWLYDYPAGRRRMLFERDADEDQMKFGRALTGGTASLEKLTRGRELVLSRAANDGQPRLSMVHDALIGGFEFARFSESSRQQRIDEIVEGLATEAIRMRDIVTLLQVADVGIAGVEVDEIKTPPELITLFKAMKKATDESIAIDRQKANSGSGKLDKKARKKPAEIDIEFAIEEVTKRLTFQHAGDAGTQYSLMPADQSTGTLSWLSLAVPALLALRQGNVLIIDEIDASLHPHLAQMLIQMFKDDALNAKAAQLIFTTHDTFFLSPSADVKLDPEEVWFVEKNRAGASEMYSLSDFGTRQDQNLSRRYLHGRFGATPRVAPAFLLDLVDVGTDAR